MGGCVGGGTGAQEKELLMVKWKIMLVGKVEEEEEEEEE